MNRMRLVSRSIALTCFLAASVALAATYGGISGKRKAGARPADGGAKAVAGAELFERPRVLDIRITIAPGEWKALQRDNRKHVRATVREGSNSWHEVGIHLKGAAGSFRGLDDKPALTLGFSKFTPDQKFHGLRKIHLNNSVQDASYMTEYLCGELFRKAGVPAARVAFARVELNGKQKGFYVLKEGFTKEMLHLYFDRAGGNLYDGGFLREVTDQLERDMGDDDVSDWSDLKALARAAQEPEPAKRFTELSKVLDVDRFISFAVLEVMTWDWDGYVMNRNNYRVYHDLETGRMVFFPHGLDQMFWQPDAPMTGNMQGLVAQGLIKTAPGRALYRQRFGELFTNVFQLEFLTNRISELASVIRPALVGLHGAGAGRDYDGQAGRIRDLVTQRHASLQRQLNTPEPKPLAFSNGAAKISGWEIPANLPEQGNARRDKVEVDGRQTLHIQTTHATSASWRSRVLLEGGRYRFEVMARTAGVAAVRDSQKGEGAGIRISGSQTPRRNRLTGDAAWQKLTYEFDAAPGEEIVLVCELRASKGQVWFDARSAQLIKLK